MKRNDATGKVGRARTAPNRRNSAGERDDKPGARFEERLAVLQASILAVISLPGNRDFVLRRVFLS